MQKYLFKNIQIVNEGKITISDLFIDKNHIEKIAPIIDTKQYVKEINGEGKFLLPGVIDNHVHFREPGLLQKGSIYSESKAAIAGGVTSFMDMPNTIPPTFTQKLLEEKYAIAAHLSLANYSFYMGTSNDNADEVLKTNEKKTQVCGIKMFLGSSTGNLLINNPATLDKLFRESEILIATHCEDDKIIQANLQKLKKENRELTPEDHPIIKDENACYESTLSTIQLAKKHNSRLHVLHITTEKELQLFSNMLPLKEKRITAEACIPHVHFSADDYKKLGNKIKCNPAIKASHNKEALWKAILNDRLDSIATDHAPHLMEEKYLTPTLSKNGEGAYELAHAGIPFVQHSLSLMLHYVKEGKISLEKVVQKMSHAVADLYNIEKRGFIREGYFADITIVDMSKKSTVNKDNILYKCGWSPLEGFTFPATITHTFVNGNLIYENGLFHESNKGMRLVFDR